MAVIELSAGAAKRGREIAKPYARNGHDERRIQSVGAISRA